MREVAQPLEGAGLLECGDELALSLLGILGVVLGRPRADLVHAALGGLLRPQLLAQLEQAQEIAGRP